MNNAKEIFKSNEGIDTINISLKWCNADNVKLYLEKHGNKIGKGITIKLFRGYCFLVPSGIPCCSVHIQAEALDLNKNIKRQIADIVFLLSKKGLIDLPYATQCDSEEKIKEQTYFFLNYIVTLSRLDIHFDFPEDAVKLLNPLRFKDQKTGSYSYTSYSEEGRKAKQSHWCAYDRRPRLLYVNQIPKEVVQNMLYPMRIEYRLKPKNTPYLSLDNLNGPFIMVYALYANTMARSWRDRGAKIAFVNPDFKSNPYFYHLFMVANQSKPIKTNTKLAKKKDFLFSSKEDNYVRQTKEKE